MKKKRRMFPCNPYIIGMVVLVIASALLGYGMLQVRYKILANAQELGSTLVQSYAAEEKQIMGKFVEYAELAYQYVEQLEEQGETTETIRVWLKDYFENLSALVGEDVFATYAVVNGEFMATNGWEGAEGYAYWEQPWYRDAVAANGEVVISDGYTDAATGQTIFSISKQMSSSRDVILIDIYISNPEIHSSLESLPEGAAFYICDAKGTVLYRQSQRTNSADEAQQLADQLLQKIQNGDFRQHSDLMESAEGRWYGVYYSEMDLGWTILITMPLSSVLLMGDNNLAFYALGLGFAVFFGMLLAMYFHDKKKTKQIQEDGEIIKILGNSFGGIVRINTVTGNYKALKMPRGPLESLPETGDYAVLLEKILEGITPEYHQEYELSFSLESIRQRMKEGISDYGRDFLQEKDGDHLWVNTRTIHVPEVLKDDVILCFRDVDAEKRKQLQHTILLKDALDTAHKSSKAKSSFFSSMSHDMRTPLNAVIGCTELAREALQRQQGEKVQEYLGKIEYASHQLLGLVNDILELSKMEAGKNAIEEITFDMEAFLTETVDLFREVTKEQQKTITLITDIKNRTVKSDKKKLGQILNNLLSNAVKYTNPGGTIQVEVRQFDFKHHSKFQIVVEDTGVGMSQEFLSHLFDPYSRETTFTGTTTVGIGLGMTIVKSLVQQFSGEISVESTLGEGSRFTVTLPLKVVEEEEEEAQPEQTLSNTYD